MDNPPYCLAGCLFLVNSDDSTYLAVPDPTLPLTPQRARIIAAWLERWADTREAKGESP